jgi:hypothetical protein
MQAKRRSAASAKLPELDPPHDPRRLSKFITVETCQRPPRRVRMPRAFIPSAIARRLVAPPARMSSTTALRSSACRSAFRAMASLSGCPPRPARPSPSQPSSSSGFKIQCVWCLCGAPSRTSISVMDWNEGRPCGGDRKELICALSGRIEGHLANALLERLIDFSGANDHEPRAPEIRMRARYLDGG